MGLFNNIKEFGDNFHSIRLHNEILLVDLKFPADWLVEEVLKSQPTSTQMKINDTNDEVQLISFYCVFAEKESAQLLIDVNRVLKFNRDQQEKRELLNVKMLELKKIFDTNEVSSLRDINFNFQDNVPTQNKNLKLDERTESTMVSEGN